MIIISMSLALVILAPEALSIVERYYRDTHPEENFWVLEESNL